MINQSTCLIRGSDESGLTIRKTSWTVQTSKVKQSAQKSKVLDAKIPLLLATLICTEWRSNGNGRLAGLESSEEVALGGTPLAVSGASGGTWA
jgi:hypothetical protein